MNGPREYDDAGDVTGKYDVMTEDGDNNWEPDDDVDEEGDDEDAEFDPEEEGDEEVELEASDEDADEGEFEEEEGDEDEEESDEDEVAPIDPPANWPKQEQEFFRNLSPQMQHAYLDRARHMTADYTRKTQELAQIRQHYNEFDRVIGPRVQQWALNGMAPAQAVQQLIALSDFATNQPKEFLQYFANLRGVDLNELSQGQQEEYVDPQVSALRQQLAQVQAHLNQSTQYQQHVAQQQQAAQYQQAFSVTNSAIDNFANQRGQDGKPLYPYFNELEEDMAAEIETGRAQTIQEAYERAKWSNPYTRSKLLARQLSQQNAQQRQRAQEARRAGSSISGSSSFGSPATSNMSVRDLLESAMDGQL
jgi:hypothetical protein